MLCILDSRCEEANYEPIDEVRLLDLRGMAAAWNGQEVSVQELFCRRLGMRWADDSVFAATDDQSGLSDVREQRPDGMVHRSTNRVYQPLPPAAVGKPLFVEAHQPRLHVTRVVKDARHQRATIAAADALDYW